jgi:hypothetical protein
MAWSHLKEGLFKSDPKSWVTNQMDKYTLGDQEDNGRTVFETEQATKSLPWRWHWCYGFMKEGKCSFLAWYVSEGSGWFCCSEVSGILSITTCKKKVVWERCLFINFKSTLQCYISIACLRRYQRKFFFVSSKSDKHYSKHLFLSAHFLYKFYEDRIWVIYG